MSTTPLTEAAAKSIAAWFTQMVAGIQQSYGFRSQPHLHDPVREGVLKTLMAEHLAPIVALERDLAEAKEQLIEAQCAIVSACRLRDRQIAELREEIRYLRHYGNKDCTAMADEARANDTLDRLAELTRKEPNDA